jgi:hypothetical protein
MNNIQSQSVEEQYIFFSSDEQFNKIKTDLLSQAASEMNHHELESMLDKTGTELLRRLFQNHLSLRAQQECDLGLTSAVVGSDGIERIYQQDASRKLMSLFIFGPVRVERISFRAKDSSKLHPLDAKLNLPKESYSHGVCRRVAEEVSKNSFDETVSTIESTTGASVPKRQAEQLSKRAAQDFDGFYAQRKKDSRKESTQTGSIVVVSVDGKGVVMRNEDLREATRKAAEKRKLKTTKRMSKGEEKHAEVWPQLLRCML